MTRPGSSDDGDVNVFRRFSQHFPSAAWRPYYARWERHAALRFEHSWLVRAEIEVHGGSRAFVRIFFSSRSRSRVSPEGEPGFDGLRKRLEDGGYELRVAPRLPMVLLLKRFRPTGTLLAEVRREVEASFWPDEPATRRGAASGEGGIGGAMLHFARAPEWIPSSCGWSRHLRLRDGTEVVLALLLVQGRRRGPLQPDAEVLLYPLQSADRALLRKVTRLVRTAGYRGKLDTARPPGREPFLFAHFAKDRLGAGGAAVERARLDELAAAMRRAS